MKKTTLRTVAMALVMTMMLAFTACGNTVTSVEDYLKTDMMQEMIKETKDEINGSGMSIDIRAEGNTLIYEYTFDDGSFDDSMLDAVKEQLVSGLASDAAAFEDVAADINSDLKIDDCILVVRYLYNGETLVESEYTAN